MIFPDRKDFWQARHAKFGHTGWASRKIYAFDQFVRLSRFVDLLDENNIKPGVALDFGCGAGDFSRVLLDRGWSVVAYDPFVDPQICHDRLLYINSLAEVMLPHRFDLVVSITALDHCVDDMEFEERMGQIANSLRPGGKFVFLEYSVDHFREKTSYQAFRSVKAWRDMLSNFELRLLGEDPFFHPQFAPISAWVVYSRSFFVRMIGLVERLRIQKAGAIRTRYLRKLLLKFPYEAPRESPIKLMWGQR